jgi:monoamine oxidase
MSAVHTGWTRRRFLQMVGLAGGSTALYDTMTAMGLITIPDVWAGPLQLPPGSGSGTKILILGAGIGGLTTAYELWRAGFECQILEAKNRAGGRNFTARRGTIVREESPEHGVTHQESQLDDGLYLNMGPGRLPHHHRRVLHYCQELGVALEVYIMETTANLFQTDKAFGGRPQTTRSIGNDTRGYIAELLAKSIHKHTLDQELDEGDRENLLSLLRVYGDLGDAPQGTLMIRMRIAAPNAPDARRPIRSPKPSSMIARPTSPSSSPCSIRSSGSAGSISRQSSSGSQPFSSRWAAWTRS